MPHGDFYFFRTQAKYLVAARVGSSIAPFGCLGALSIRLFQDVSIEPVDQSNSTKIYHLWLMHKVSIVRASPTPLSL
jgi:hypothetical protein